MAGTNAQDPKAMLDDEVEGHRQLPLGGSEDDDVEGHRLAPVQPPRDEH
jgi:hypothetical protein